MVHGSGTLLQLSAEGQLLTFKFIKVMKIKTFIENNITKFLLLFAALLITLSLVKQCNAQSKLTYSSDFELGYETFAHNVLPELTSTDAYYKSPWLITGSLSFGLHYWKLHLNNEVVSYFNNLSTETFSFNVYFIDYRLNAYFKHGRYEIGYKHHCFHPIYSNHYILIESTSSKFYLKIQIN